MSESFWGTFIISAGVIIIALIFFMQKITNSGEQTYTILKETTEAAMLDAVDYSTMFRTEEGDPIVRMNREAFVESFIRRFSQNASLANTYVVEFYDVNEYPPKVSIRLKTKEGGSVANQEFTFDINNQIDAILETENKGVIIE